MNACVNSRAAYRCAPCDLPCENIPIHRSWTDVPGESERQVKSIEAIVEQFGPSLWRLAGSFEFDAALREDLVQDMLVAIWRALPRLDDPTRLTPYVLRIARNRAVSHVARQARRPDRSPITSEPDDTGSGPYETAEQNDRQQRLLAAVQSLPLGQREVITLFLEGLSHAEIAEILEISENNVAVRINRARARLTTRLST